MLRKLLDHLRRVTSTGVYDPRIDGLRALAILPVVFFHASLRGERVLAARRPLSAAEQWLTLAVPRGESGVVLFFFISGFIIAFPFFRAIERERPLPTVGWFYKRRAMRLMPAYLIALTAAFLALQLTGYAPADAPKFNAISTPLPLSYAASLIYQHNMIFGASSRILPPIWTLEIEIQFYVFAPFLLAWYATAPERLRRGTMVALIVLSLVANDWLPLSHLAQPRLALSILGYLHFFLAGILVSDLMFMKAPQPRAWGDILLVGGYLTLLACSTADATTVGGAFLRDGGMLVGVLATYFGGMFGRHGARFLSTRAVAVMGGACYSIYLIHLPFIQAYSEVIKRFARPDSLSEVWLLMLPSIPIALFAGMLFYAAVERPTMKPDWPQRLLLALRSRHAAPAQN